MFTSINVSSFVDLVNWIFLEALIYHKDFKAIIKPVCHCSLFYYIIFFIMNKAKCTSYLSMLLFDINSYDTLHRNSICFLVLNYYHH